MFLLGMNLGKEGAQVLHINFNVFAWYESGERGSPGASH
jgi:hypothetical protein